MGRLIRNILIYTLILLGISGIDLLPERVLSHRNALMLQYAVYCAMILLWSVSAGKRIVGQSVRRMQKTVVFLFILLLFFSRLRRVVFAGVYPAEHILWYMFYIPNLAIPLVSFFMTLYVGRDDNYRMSSRMKLMWIPYALLVLLILTNEFHQLAFRLSDRGHAVSIAGKYRLAPVYYLAQLWLFGLALLAVGSLYRLLRVNRLRAYALPPVVMLVLGIVYTVLYAFDRSPTGVGYIEPNAMVCFSTIGLWELCIAMHLIPSNDGYTEWFRACRVPMEITDSRGNIRYSSAGALEESGKASSPAGKRRVFVTREYEIPGGSIRWREDVTHIQELIRELEEGAALLKESNEKLAAQNRMQMQAAKTREQARLYDRALRDITGRMNRMRALLKTCRQEEREARDDAKLRSTLARIGVLGAYAKRRSNLVLLRGKSGVLPLTELHFCLHESNEALVLIPVSTVYRNEADPQLSARADDVIRVYDAFQNEVEAVLDTLEYMRITLKGGESVAELQLFLGGEQMGEKNVQIIFAPEEQAV